MRSLKQALSPLLCCFGMHSSDEDHTVSDLTSLQKPASTLSIALPATTVPHALGPSESNPADADALRRIFRSSSSVRGYQAASMPPSVSPEGQSSGSLMTRPLSSHGKRPGRMEQFGTHIRQNLSESRLSKSSSKAHMELEDAPHELTVQKGPPLGMEIAEASLSQRSTGLLELLMSRSGSDGGYDSDAKSIQTTVLKENDGTTRLSSTEVKKLSKPAELPVSVGSSPRKSPNIVRQKDVARSAGSASSQISFTEILAVEKNNSPTTVLQRLNAALVNGTVTLPVTPKSNRSLTSKNPEVKSDSAQDESPLGLGGPPDYPSPEVVDVLKRLSGTVAAAKRESLHSTIENPRASLVSYLEPELLEFISKYGEPISTELVEKRLPEDAPESFHSSTPLDSDATVAVVAPALDNEGTSGRNLTSFTESDRSSIHLYNMRISQRLASPSFVAGGSRPNTSHTSIQQSRKDSADIRPSTSQASSTSRFPSWIATEHNRRPSDPQTRRLFEDDRIPRRSPSQRSRVTSENCASGIRNSKPSVTHDDASSFYWSDGDFDESETDRGKACRRKKNLNSLAIGGRSESVCLPVASSIASMSRPSIAEESIWFSRRSSQQPRTSNDVEHHSASQRTRSVSMPNKTSRQSQNIRSVLGVRSTEANEGMSEIGAEQIRDAKAERMTEISAQAVHDVLNERMSETEPPAFLKTRMERSTGRSNSSFLSDARRSLSVSDVPGHKEGRQSQSQDPTRPDYSSKGILEDSANNTWRRTLKRAMEEPLEEPLGGFLAAPRFDREGRRRSTSSSISTIGSNNKDTDSESALAPGDGIRQRQPSSGETQESDPLPTVSHRGSIVVPTTISRRPTSLKQKKKKKKSLRDIGRRFTATDAANGESAPGASTPLRDLFGLWGRLPSHTRESRCGSADAKDGVAVRDFGVEHAYENTPSSSAPLTPWNRSTTALGLHTPGSWRGLSFGRKGRIDRAKSKSLTLPRTADAAPSWSRAGKGHGKGLLGKWRRLYRSSSSDLRAYVHTYGHRSSISVGGRVGYPELEIIPGPQALGDVETLDQHSKTDVTADAHQRHQREDTSQSHDCPQVEILALEAQPWSQLYQECVGSLSALMSEVELQPLNLNDEPEEAGKTKSADLRNSTVDFGVQLGKTHDAAREGLIKRVEDWGGDVVLSCGTPLKELNQD